MRFCPACGTELARRAGEKRADFLKRSYCDYRCSVADRPRRAEEKRRAQDVVDTMPAGNLDRIEFDRAEILRVAHRQAPQVPASVIADVIDHVEPLIAANARRRLMAVIGAGVRAERPPGQQHEQRAYAMKTI